MVTWIDLSNITNIKDFFKVANLYFSNYPLPYKLGVRDNLDGSVSIRLENDSTGDMFLDTEVECVNYNLAKASNFYKYFPQYVGSNAEATLYLSAMFDGEIIFKNCEPVYDYGAE